MKEIRFRRRELQCIGDVVVSSIVQNKEMETPYLWKGNEEED